MSNPNSVQNLRPTKPHPIGHKRKVGKYWMEKVGPSKWEYVHKLLAREMLGREVRPDERVYFKDGVPKTAYKDPEPEHIEIRPIVPIQGKPPGRRSSAAKRVLDLRFKLKEAEAKLAALNEFYGRPPGDVSDSAQPRKWNGA